MDNHTHRIGHMQIRNAIGSDQQKSHLARGLVWECATDPQCQVGHRVGQRECRDNLNRNNI
jgi:hypothetical protein